jgi:uncharacterized protein (TIGR00369 family)
VYERPRAVGELVRFWRERRRLTQLEVSVETGISTRHLSYVETGRAQPSRELLGRIAEHLQLPFGERNQVLLAGGYARTDSIGKERGEPVPDTTDGPVPDDLVTAMPFARELGVTLEKAESARVVGSLVWAAHRCTTGGALHGGVLMGLADSLGGICAFLNLPAGSLTSTIESKTNFFRAVRSGTVTGVASPVHVGGTTIVVQTELRDDAQRLVALAIQTQVVLAPRS